MKKILDYIRTRIDATAQESDVRVPVEPLVRTISYAEARIMAARERRAHTRVM